MSENLKSPCAIVWRCLSDPVFSRFGTVPACDIQIDGHTTGTLKLPDWTLQDWTLQAWTMADRTMTDGYGQLV